MTHSIRLAIAALLSLPLSAVLTAPALAQQQNEPALRADTKPAPWPREVHFEQEGKPDYSSPVGLRAVEQFGACVADTSTSKATQVVAADFRTPAYRRGMDVLIEANRGCPSSRRWYRMKSSRLLVAGAIAERLIERDGGAINVRLARAAMAPPTPAFSPSDAGAICLVRSVPDDVARLFATEVGSAQEKAVAGPLQALLSRCMSGAPIETNVSGLRAIVATAAFRSIHGAQAEKRN